MTEDSDPANPPTATYRLQLRREFGFRDAAQVVPYLADLGVSHVYCSPVLEAVSGSAHGYDVIDHSRLSSDLGGDSGWRELATACRVHGLGLVVDIVPNHMAVPTPASRNKVFWDVLINGRHSEFADWFDVDWDAQGGKILLPVLGEPLSTCLASGALSVDREARLIRYFDHEFPVAPETAGLIDDIALLDAQHYRLAHWRAAATDLNYRRFFDVTSLIGVRVEEPRVFGATHARVLDLVRSGDVTGLRIDHPDGLADPQGYLEQLRGAAGDVWTVVEKILEFDEELPSYWRCDGTTGYDAITAISHLLLDPKGKAPLAEFYAELTGSTADFDHVVESSKRQILDTLLGAEIERLVRDLDRVRAAVPEAPDLDRDTVRDALVELLVAFDVYRTYPGHADSALRLDAAARQSVERAPHTAEAVQWIARLLRREVDDPTAFAFATRLEQTTGPVMAKGVEDTAFYRYLRLTALNEVGGDPGRFGLSIADWHRRCARLVRDWPAAMTTLTTHDTKRSEDVRARLLVLAELPDEWRRAVTEWRRMAERHDPSDSNTDYLFWQTLVGAWPLTLERMQAYLAKATREAKTHTSWIDPDEKYDAALKSYAENVFADEELMSTVGEWCAQHIEEPGHSNALAQKLIQLTMPGVPDVYQGQELVAPALVDPDNRRPVDYDMRRRQLAAIDRADTKLLVTARCLRLRRDLPATFRAGYDTVDVHGPAADHAVAYRRGDDVIAVATRLPVTLGNRGGWEHTSLALPPGAWIDVLTDRPVEGALADLTARLPVALLQRQGG